MTPIQRVLEAIEEIKKGNMIIMCDDEDRENEGDLVYASVFSTPEHVNFMAKEARGLICVTLGGEIAERLELNPMVSSNNSMYETAFTVSVDAADALTGISAAERDMTINILANPLSKASELARPGHIFPLIAKDGGTLVRTGHTEGSVDICRLAGLTGCGVICEIIKDDGEMARRDDLDVFAKKHQLKTVFISDIVAYRLANEILVNQTHEEEIDFFGMTAQKRTFVDHEGLEHTAIAFHHIGETANVKVHNVISDIDLLLNQEKYGLLIDSIEYLKQNGGVLLFVNNPDQNHSNIKEFGVGAQILKLYGITQMRLLTSSELPEFVGLSGFGLEVLETVNPALK